MLSRKVVTLLSSNMHLEDFPSNRTSMASSKIFQLAVTLCVCDYTPYYIPVLYTPINPVQFYYHFYSYPMSIPLISLYTGWLRTHFPVHWLWKSPTKTGWYNPIYSYSNQSTEVLKTGAMSYGWFMYPICFCIISIIIIIIIIIIVIIIIIEHC